MAGEKTKTKTAAQSGVRVDRRKRGDEKRSGLELIQERMKRASDLLKQASDPTRLMILGLLAVETRNVGAIIAEVGGSQAGVSHHLSLLRHGGLVETRRDGKAVFYSLTERGRNLASVVAALG